MSAGLLAGVFAHGWIGDAGVHMGYLFPEVPGCPTHGVVIGSMFGDVAPMVGAALFAVQLLKPLIAQHKHGIGMDHELGDFGGHAALLEFLCTQQMQKIFSAVPAKDLVLMFRTNELPTFRAPVARLVCGLLRIDGTGQLEHPLLGQSKQ